jgi:signal transduction histidine kinase
MRAALSLALEAMSLEGEASPELKAALREVERLQSTIDTLLAVARDTPRGESTTELRPLVEEVEQAWHGPLAERARPLRVSLEPDDPVVEASRRVVREILDVLLSNACRHGQGAVTIVTRETGDWVALDVIDEGGTIEQSESDLFARRRGSEDGHGIGLALARSLAHAEGGRLVLGSRAPRTTFTLFLRSTTLK